MRRIQAAAMLAVALLGGCAPLAMPPGELTAVELSALPGWAADRVSQLLPGLRAQCRRLGMMPAETDLGGTGVSATYGGKAGDWTAPCAKARGLAPGDDAAMRRFLADNFQPYRIATPALVTGYYEPELRGSRTPGPAFAVPVLGRPDDLAERPAAGAQSAPERGRWVNGVFTAYATRAEIEAGALGAHARPLLYVASATDLFFLQVQGSGRVALPDGRVVRVGFAGSNGQPYTPIGRVLVSMGALAPSDVTLSSLRAWLAAHPDQAKSVMDRNARYVFFREVASATDEGPPGALGVDLTPMRSAAVDRHCVPLGAPVWVATRQADGTARQGLALAQDLGTDINGPARLDLFMGWGAGAEAAAGRMRETGMIYLLLPRPG